MARPRRHGRHRGVRTGPTAPGAARAPGSFLCKSFCAALTLTETRQDLANFGGQRVKTSGEKAAALSRVQPVLAGHPAASADVPGGRLGPHERGRHRHPVDRDRGAARPPATHRAEPTTEIDQAHTSAASAAPRSRKPGLAAGGLPLVAQAGPRLLAGMPAPPPGRTWCSGQRPKDEPPTDQVGRGPLRCRASLMEAKRRGEPEGSSPVPPGDSGDEGALGVPGAEGASCPLGAMASPWTQESRVQRGRRRAVGTAAPPGPAPQQAGGPGAERSGWPKRAERPGSHRLAGHSGVHTPAHQRRGRESNL